MAVQLKKGQGVSLLKSANDLSSVTIGLGWDVAEPKKSFLGGLMGTKTPDYDLDVVAFLCGDNGKVNDIGTIDPKMGPIGGDIVFFNSKQHPSGAIWLTGDNRTGAGAGDDEQIIANLEAIPGQYQKIVFIVQIYSGIKLKQSFANVKNAYIRAVDKRGTEMARFDLSGAEYGDAYSMIFAELQRESSGWKLNAVGKPYKTDSFGSILRDGFLP